MFETDDFKRQLRAAIANEAARNKATFQEEIVEYLQKLASGNERELMEKELRKSIGERRGLPDALNSARDLVQEALKYSAGNNLTVADIQKAYQAKFCRIWPFCK